MPKSPEQFPTGIETTNPEEKEGLAGWKLEGKLTEEKVLAEYEAGGYVWAANFSPEGDKVVIGSDDGMVKVIGEKEV